MRVLGRHVALAKPNLETAAIEIVQRSCPLDEPFTAPATRLGRLQCFNSLRPVWARQVLRPVRETLASIPLYSRRPSQQQSPQKADLSNLMLRCGMHPVTKFRFRDRSAIPKRVPVAAPFGRNWPRAAEHALSASEGEADQQYGGRQTRSALRVLPQSPQLGQGVSAVDARRRALRYASEPDNLASTSARAVANRTATRPSCMSEHFFR